MEDQFYYLEPCPFCGGVDLEYGHCKDTLGMAFVRCVACQAEIRQYNTTAKVVNAWNARATVFKCNDDGNTEGSKCFKCKHFEPRNFGMAILTGHCKKNNFKSGEYSLFSLSILKLNDDCKDFSPKEKPSASDGDDDKNI